MMKKFDRSLILEDFFRIYQADHKELQVPSAMEIDAIFCKMGKFTEEQRRRDIVRAIDHVNKIINDIIIIAAKLTDMSKDMITKVNATSESGVSIGKSMEQVTTLSDEVNSLLTQTNEKLKQL